VGKNSREMPPAETLTWLVDIHYSGGIYAQLPWCSISMSPFKGCAMEFDAEITTSSSSGELGST
jgi:hypothetical protein